MSITIFKFPVVCSKNLSENDKEHEKILVDKEVQTDEKYSKIPKLGNYNKNDFLQKKRIRKIKKKKFGRKKKMINQLKHIQNIQMTIAYIKSKINLLIVFFLH